MNLFNNKTMAIRRGSTLLLVFLLGSFTCRTSMADWYNYNTIHEVTLTKDALTTGAMRLTVIGYGFVCTTSDNCKSAIGSTKLMATQLVIQPITAALLTPADGASPANNTAIYGAATSTINTTNNAVSNVALSTSWLNACYKNALIAQGNTNVKLGIKANNPTFDTWSTPDPNLQTSVFLANKTVNDPVFCSLCSKGPSDSSPPYCGIAK